MKIMLPTSTKLWNRAHEKLVAWAKKTGVALRWSYARVANRALRKLKRHENRNDVPHRKVTPKLQFKIVSLDDILKKGNTFPFRFEVEKEFSFNLSPNTIIGIDVLNSSVAERINNGSKLMNGSLMGTIQFENIYLLGPLGIIIDRERSICWSGNPLGWHRRPLLSGFRRYSKAIKLADHEHMEIDSALFEEADSFERSALLSSPGFNAYGHWLIDILPRMFRLDRFVRDSFAVYAPEVPGWAKTLCDQIGYGAVIGAQSAPSKIGLSHHQLLAAPTLIRRLRAIDEKSAAIAWDHLKSRLDAHGSGPINADYGDKIYVSRRLWQEKSTRREGMFLKNGEAIESHLARKGFSIIYPERLSFLEQKNAFSRASIIVGEDGSGLHNCIFAPPGAKIGVIHLGRENAYHAIIANCADQHVHYIETQVVEGAKPGVEERDLPIDKLNSALEEMLSFKGNTHDQLQPAAHIKGNSSKGERKRRKMRFRKNRRDRWPKTRE